MDNQTNNCIHIRVKEGQVQVTFDAALSLVDFLQLISTAALSAMQQTVANLPEEEKQRATEDIYDMYNAAASNTLHYFAPEIDMRPHLTSQAILEAENQIIERMAKKNAQHKKPAFTRVK